MTGNISLPTSGTNGSTITWSSSAPQIISNSGGVTVPSDTDANVTMTATIAKGEKSDTRDFPMTVKALLLSAWVSPAGGLSGQWRNRSGFQASWSEYHSRYSWIPATVNDSTFQIIQTNNSQNVPIVVTYDDPSRTVSLTPQAPLAEGTQYSMVVSTALRDAEDNSLPSRWVQLHHASPTPTSSRSGSSTAMGSDASSKRNDLSNITEASILRCSRRIASLYLDGTGQNGTSNINLGSQLTVAVWVNVDNPIQDSLNTMMSNTDTGESSNGFKLCINRWATSDESVVIEVGNGATGGKWATAPGLIQPGFWYHLAFAIDQPNHVMKIYYNGSEAPLTFMSDEGFTQGQFQYNFKTAGPFLVGSFPGNSYGFRGHLDDMRVYNRVLSDEEIAKIAQEK